MDVRFESYDEFYAYVDELVADGYSEEDAYEIAENELGAIDPFNNGNTII